ncbi:hypothetical protein [Sporomusa malonica]|uniref:Uncharacterized protein n=1 Tax=Sporomusa malonica TaxID=112901 RepID=A0A1W2F313_9FIRM|nr:hypothetical protein [Sporomusa malonica]SMD15838.1 hypothetical protein SAMN04488500_13914 [Sporomusa malonica]
MKDMVKKIIIFSMVGLLQIGMMASLAEASPKYEKHQRYEHRRNNHDSHMWERENNRRIHAENARHEHEMRRRPFESKKNWHKRQQREIERHKQAIREIMQHRYHR